MTLNQTHQQFLSSFNRHHGPFFRDDRLEDIFFDLDNSGLERPYGLTDDDVADWKESLPWSTDPKPSGSRPFKGDEPRDWTTI